MLESLEEGRLCFSRIDRVESDLIYEENIKYRGKETGCGEGSRWMSDAIYNRSHHEPPLFVWRPAMRL
jgi:hypothetical protein